jgi:hypothetical protein
MSLRDVIVISFQSLRHLFINRDYFLWFRKVSIKCLLIATFIVMALMTGGSYAITQLGTSGWYDFGAIIWALLVFYFSGALTVVLMPLLMSFLINEGQLIHLVSGSKPVNMKKLVLKWRVKEWQASFISLICALVAAPLLIIPLTLPIGFIFLMWGMGREFSQTAIRVLVQSEIMSENEASKISFKLKFYLGFFPALLTLIPFLSLIAWPLSLVASLEVLRVAVNNRK